MTESPAMNPHVTPSPAGRTDLPLAELKQHLLLFVESPPGPRTVRRVLDLYFATWGDPFVEYASTAFGAGRSAWDERVRRRFFVDELPNLRRYSDWGYSFSDGQTLGSWRLMFHGYFPFSQPDKTSFFWFEYDWQVDAQRLGRFASDMLGLITCVSGYAGYMFQNHPLLVRSSYDQVFLWARRFWGVEVHDLDVTPDYVAHGLKCVNWLTVVGERLRRLDRSAVGRATRVAHASRELAGGTLLQATEEPRLGDRNRLAVPRGYVALAQALKPIQIEHHGAFSEGSGSRWTEEATGAWLRRFTEPEGWAG